MQIFKFQSGSKDWHSKRCKVITGTEIATLYGLNKYLSVPKLVDKKIKCQKGIEEPREDNSILRTGRMMENVAIASAAELGYYITPATEANHVLFITDGHLGASLDGIYHDKKLGMGIAECKSTENDSKFKDWLDGNLPPHYLLQLQAQLGIYNLPFGLFVGVHSKPPFSTVIYQVTQNKEIYEIFLLTIAKFWDNIKKDEKNTTNKEGKARILELLPSTIKKLDTAWLGHQTKETNIWED